MALLRSNEPNNLGTRVTVVPLPGARGPGKRVPMIQLRDAEDSEAQTLSIVLIPAVAPLDEAPHGPCVAILEWGTGNATVSAEVDFAKGTHIQLAASFLSIAARNDGNVFDGATSTVDPNPGPQDVIAMVSGYGGRVAFGRTTRTFYFRGIPPAGAVTVVVPNFAKSLTVSRSPATASLHVDFLDNMTFPPTGPDPGTEPGIRATYDFVGVTPPSIDLPGITSSVLVRNAGTTPITFMQLAFELSL
jgi:hypothetical protein